MNDWVLMIGVLMGIALFSFYCGAVMSSGSWTPWRKRR